MFNITEIRAYRQQKKLIMEIGEQIKPFAEATYDIQKTVDFLIKTGASASTIKNHREIKANYQKQTAPLRKKMGELQEKTRKYTTHYEIKTEVYSIIIDFHTTGALVRLKGSRGEYITDPDYMLMGSKVLSKLSKVIREVERAEEALNEDY